MLLTKGIVDRFGRKSNGGNIPSRFTSLGSQAVGIVEPEWAELLRANRCYYGGNTTAASGIAPDTAMPTTAPKLSLVNNEPATGRSYLVYHVSAVLLSGTAAAAGSVGIALSDGAQAVPIAASANTKVSSLSRASKHPSAASFSTAVTMVGTPLWSYYVADNALAASALFGAGVRALDFGRPIALVPPGFALGFSVASGAGTTPLYTISVWWAELDIDIE